MIQIIKYPAKQDWKQVLERPAFDESVLHETVRAILNDVKGRGDEAVLAYEAKFDKVKLDTLAVSEAEIAESEQQIPDELKSAIRTAKRNIEIFHSAQRLNINKIETTAGVTCWQKAVGIEKVGLYVPGGTAPLFSTVLMLAVPAKIAGCKEIVLCSPPNAEGKIHPAILFAAKEAGVGKIVKIGGVQAIGAMAYGTESVPKVYKIFGPGNQYVMAAKQLVGLCDVAIDMPAGPSEVEVIADETANPAFVAADLLSQAEHGVDSQSLLLTANETVIPDVLTEIEKQLAVLPRVEIVRKALKNSKIIVLKNNEEIIEMTNEYAPEHLIIETKDYMALAERVINAGSVFLGHYTPESAGDYASGTNHTLPTNGYAKAYSGVNLDSYVKKITFQEITQQGIRDLGGTIEIMAGSEQLDAHKNAVSVRRNSLFTDN
jgi:histidinol dehydrogenase